MESVNAIVDLGPEVEGESLGFLDAVRAELLPLPPLCSWNDF